VPEKIDDDLIEMYLEDKLNDGGPLQSFKRKDDTRLATFEDSEGMIRLFTIVVLTVMYFVYM